MFEPKCDWWRKIRWEDKTVLLKGILSIKRKDYGRFVELALDAGMRGGACRGLRRGVAER